MLEGGGCVKASKCQNKRSSCANGLTLQVKGYLSRAKTQLAKFDESTQGLAERIVDSQSSAKGVGTKKSRVRL